jgi:magnesium transporter
MVSAMRLAQILGPDLKNALETDPQAVVEALDEFHPEDIAETLGEMEPGEAAHLLQTVPASYGGDVFERLSMELQISILETLGPADAVPLLSEMSPDDRVDLFQELPEDQAAELLARLEQSEPEAAEEVRELGAYPEDTAGGLMTTEVVTLPPEMQAAAAIEEIRRLSREQEAETIYYIYVTAYGDKLVGVLSLRDLILAEPTQTLEDVMVANVVRVLATDDQELVADTIAKYDLSAIPVVDDKGTMLGVVTVDDVFDVVIEEATEDAQLQAGVVPLEDSYFETGFFALVGKRLIWLVVLFLGQLVTAEVLDQNEATLAAVVSLVAFIPMIIASGGNAGGQSASLIIRALAVGEVQPRDWVKVMGRELAIGLALGAIIGVMGFGSSMLVSGEAGEMMWRVAATVALSIVGVVVGGAMVGAILPLGMQRVGLDPAVSSTPFIASVVDVLGLLFYLFTARLLLPI